MRRKNITFARCVVVAVVATLNILFWWNAMPQETQVPSRRPLDCVSFSPSASRSHLPGDQPDVAPEALERDLRRLAGRTRCVRTYHADKGMEHLPAIASRFGIEVMIGVWVSGDRSATQRQLEIAIDLANSQHNVSALIIGSETLQFKRVSPAMLLAYVQEAQAATPKPVSTAESSNLWLEYPWLVSAVDFGTVHLLPYWAGIAREHAVDWVFHHYQTLKKRYPTFEIVIGETGWPSLGPTHRAAVPSLANQAAFVREFTERIGNTDIRYNLIEAFDQPWKVKSTEGRVGAHWGILTHEGAEKFPLLLPAPSTPAWLAPATVSSGFALMFMTWFLTRYRRLRIAGVVLAACVSQLSFTIATLLFVTAEHEYLIGSPLIWIVVFPTALLILVMLTALVIETAEVVGDAPLPVTSLALRPRTSSRWPLVSIHVPCRDEPPEMLKQTIASLLAIDYPNFEIHIIVNNTPDEARWRPVESFCREFPDKLHFHALGAHPGFKAGALNYGLAVTAPEAEIIAVLDSDYLVEPHWLSATVPLFDDPEVAVVQAPQDHRDCDRSLFERMTADELSGFFHVGMVQRNEDNAIIQQGTMALVRRTALESAGRWSEWCIVEDAELGLRLQLRGHKLVYMARSLGRGLVPASFADYCAQRFRWAYGAVRVTLVYWRQLVGLEPGLTRAQRFRYLVGWLPWFSDAFHLLFSTVGLIASLFFIVDFRNFPPRIFAVPLIAFTLLRWSFTFLTYRRRVPSGLWRRLGAALAAVSLTYTIGTAVLRGLISKNLPFQRTAKAHPEARRRSPRQPVIRAIRFDMALAIALVVAGVTLLTRYGFDNYDALTWCLVLWLQAVPGLAAIALSLASAHRNTSQGHRRGGGFGPRWATPRGFISVGKSGGSLSPPHRGIPASRSLTASQAESPSAPIPAPPSRAR